MVDDVRTDDELLIVSLIALDEGDDKYELETEL
jgi:hypothetical protein